MEEAKALAQQHLLQQIQRQKQQQQQDAMARFPSNIDAHLRPQPFIHRQQSQSLNPTPNPNQQSPNPNPALQIPIQQTPNANPSQQQQQQLQQQQQQKLNRPAQASNTAELQMAYQDAWRVCHPDFKRPFSSLEDACERLLPYHVVADYEAEEDDKILDSDTTGQILSRSQQWDHNIAAKVAEFTATFEKQVLAFNIISRKREQGEFRTEEKLQIEQMLVQEEKLAFSELMDMRQKAGRETHEANMQMAAMVQAEQARAESHARAEMMSRGPIRASALGPRGGNILMGHDGGEQVQEVKDEEMMNGWGNNTQKDEKEPSEDFLNDEETENGEGGIQSDWRGGGELDLNTR
ncbi:putative mediator of RNA polymerase II transcription subunit 12 [Ipomoea triloba]|uniref:putative mediator of RNA polymerase II transcription subunit 12 n=1 Tax=Ipomoea triloba TaxID=35885 RepID=UPI00125E097E|nr:putative mediator of RNA polymerase II transcription subunit 12 [Ipomoea triloba]